MNMMGDFRYVTASHSELLSPPPSGSAANGFEDFSAGVGRLLFEEVPGWDKHPLISSVKRQGRNAGGSDEFLMGIACRTAALSLFMPVISDSLRPFRSLRHGVVRVGRFLFSHGGVTRELLAAYGTNPLEGAQQAVDEWCGACESLGVEMLARREFSQGLKVPAPPDILDDRGTH